MNVPVYDLIRDCIEYLTQEDCLKTRFLFRNVGDADCDFIISGYHEHGLPLPADENAVSISLVLRACLRGLPAPCIPEEVMRKMMNHQGLEDMRELIMKCAPLHRKLLGYMCLLLSRCVEHHLSNFLTLESVSALLAADMMPCPTEFGKEFWLWERRGVANVLTYMITHQYELFGNTGFDSIREDLRVETVVTANISGRPSFETKSKADQKKFNTLKTSKGGMKTFEELRKLIAGGETGEMLKLLKDSSEKLVTTNEKSGQSLLHVAVVHGNCELVSALGEKFPSLLQFKSKDGKTPLHTATSEDSRQAQTLPALLALSSVDVNVMASSGRTPLHYAARNCDAATIKTIRKHPDSDLSLTLQDCDGKTPLHWLMSFELLPAVEAVIPLLVSEEAIRKRDRKGFFPLTYAIRTQTPRVIPQLVCDEALLGQNCDRGDSVLHIAASSDSGLAIMWQLEIEARQRGLWDSMLLLMNDYGRTPLLTAAAHGSLMTCELLLEVSDVNVIDCNGRSALSLLLEKLSGDWELCESMSWAHLACLMSTPITLNLRDLDGCLPIHYARNAHLCKFMMESTGCSFSVPDYHDCTILDLAVAEKDPDLIKYLKEFFPNHSLKKQKTLFKRQSRLATPR